MVNLTPILNKLKDWKRQKGVTFLEILAVLVILVLIYLAYARSFGAGTDKAKISDVQNSFKQYQIGFENAMDEASGLPSSNGINIDYSLLNKYLNKDFQLSSPSNGTGSTHPTANPIQTSNMKDPWGNNFQVQAKYISPSESMLTVRSKGKDKQNTVTTDLFYNTQTGTDADDIVMISDYVKGSVKSCTKGLSKDLGNANITGAGLTPTLYQVSDTMRSTWQPTYAHEYYVDLKHQGNVYRSFIYSNTPLDLITDPYGSGYEVKDRNDTHFDGLMMWYLNIGVMAYKTDPNSAGQWWGLWRTYTTDASDSFVAFGEVASMESYAVKGCN